MSLFYPVFKLLNDHEIRYIVVGGIATVMHGYLRATADIDLVIDLHDAEAHKTMQTLTEAGYVPRAPVDAMDFADQQTREAWIREKDMTVFSMYHPDNPVLSIDLFARSPLSFDDLWAHSVLMQVDDTLVRTCSLQDLIDMKQAVGRARDIDDVEHLLKIQQSLQKGTSHDG